MNKAVFSDYAFISLGANLPGTDGNPADTIKAVLPQLQALSDSVLLISALYTSDPKDCPPGSPLYSNAVVGLVPRIAETPQSLLAKMQQLEAEYGRVRSGVINEARTLDFDLLVFRSEASTTPALILPHPRAHERRFVLEPWQAIAGAAYILQGKTLAQWLLLCKDPALRIQE